jgi:hypothetical protein
MVTTPLKSVKYDCSIGRNTDILVCVGEVNNVYNIRPDSSYSCHQSSQAFSEALQ